MLHALIINNLSVVSSWRAKFGSRRLSGPSAVCPQSTGLALQAVAFHFIPCIFLLRPLAEIGLLKTTNSSPLFSYLKLLCYSQISFHTLFELCS